MPYIKSLMTPGIYDEDCNEIVENLGAMRKITAGQIDKTEKRPYDMPGKFPYPNNLIADVKDIDPMQLIEECYSDDRLIGISTALSSLTEQEETVINMRYKHGATLKQILRFYDYVKCSCFRSSAITA